MVDNAENNLDLSENGSKEKRNKKKKSMSWDRSLRRISSTSSRDSSSSSSSSNEGQRSKKWKKKHKKRKFKKCRWPKSSTQETSQFRAVNQENQFNWELLETMAGYVNDHLKIFIQEKNLKESVLKTTAVP